MVSLSAGERCQGCSSTLSPILDMPLQLILYFKLCTLHAFSEHVTCTLMNLGKASITDGRREPIQIGFYSNAASV